MPCARAHRKAHACTSGLVRSALSAAIEDENVKNMDSQRVKKMEMLYYRAILRY